MTPAAFDLPAYLRKHGLVPPTLRLDRLVIDEDWRRNHVARVRQPEGPAYFVKQAPPGADAAFVTREIALYGHAVSDDSLDCLRACLPRCYAADSAAGILVLELLDGHSTLRAHNQALGRFPASVARQLGDALRRIHDETSNVEVAMSLPAEPHWVLDIHHPPLHILDTLSSASIEYIKTIQRFPELGEHLDGLRNAWAPGSLIHGDLGWDNCLVASADLRLVDWEFCGFGDPLWDAGCVFAAYLSFWQESMPPDPALPAEALPALARYPVERMQPAMRAFWHAYSRHNPRRMAVQSPPLPAGRGGRRVRTGDPLLMAIGYCAARLLEIAYGEMQAAQALSVRALVLTQLSLNLLRRPAEAASALLGIEPAQTRP